MSGLESPAQRFAGLLSTDAIVCVLAKLGINSDHMLKVYCSSNWFVNVLGMRTDHSAA